MTGPLRLAVIGVGDVAYRDYLPHAGRVAHLGRVEMVISRDRARVDKAAQDFSVPRAETDWRAALDPGIDAVINLTPAPVHSEINLALAQAGRSFYSEKPYALSVADGRAIRDAAAQSGAVVAAAPSVMVYPQVMRAAEILASGEIGAVRSVRSNANTSPPPWGGYIGDHAPFFSAKVGPLSDMGVYPLHALTGLLGNVAEVSAISRRSRTSFVVPDGPFAGTVVPVEGDDNWQIIMALDSGVLATLQVAFCVTQAEGCTIDIAGEKGSILVQLLDPAAPITVLSPQGQRREAVPHDRNDGPDHILGVQDFLLAIRDGRDPVINVDHGLHVLAIREAAMTSSATGRRIDVATFQ